MTRSGRVQRLVDRYFSRDGFRGPVLTLLSGTGFTFLLVFFAQPILTRLYDASAFGVSDYFVTILSVLITVSSMRYEDAVMLPEDDVQAANVLGLSLGITVAVCGMLCLIIPFASPVLVVFGVPDFAPFLWYLPPTLLLMRISKLGELWFTRKRRFRSITGADIANKLTMVTTRIGAGSTGNPGPAGLIGGFVAALVASVSAYLFRLRLDGLRELREFWNGTVMRNMARRYRRFPQYSMPSALLGALVSRLPILLLPTFFSMAVVGHFGRALIVLAVPMGLIGGAVANVFFVHAAESLRSGSTRTLTATIHRRLVFIGLYPTLLLIVAAPDLFAWAFGSAWRPAGELEQYVAIWLFLTGIASPLTRIFDVLERQRLDLTISVVMFTLLLTGLVVGGKSGNWKLTFLLLGTAGAAARCIQIIVLLRLAEVGWREMLIPYLRYAFVAAPFLAAVIITLRAQSLWLTAGVSAVTGAGYYAWIIWKEKLLQPAPQP